MMTGRDLIIYILTHGLENETIVSWKMDGGLIGFMTDVEAAEKFNVGLATVYAWADMNMIEFVRLGDSIFIPENAERPVTNK